MSWHPSITQDVARERQLDLRVDACRHLRAPSPRFRRGLAGTLRLLADRLDGIAT